MYKTMLENIIKDIIRLFKKNEWYLLEWYPKSNLFILFDQL
jgi:hypothetical protein